MAKHEYTWDKLRQEHPGKYENTISPVPEPVYWFHVTIIIEYPAVNVFINNSKKPSLTVEQLISQREGWIGGQDIFWVSSEIVGNLRKESTN